MKPNRTSKECYDSYPPYRREIYLFILVGMILIPSIYFVFTQLQPSVEKVYIVHISNEFSIQNFNVTYFDIGVNNDSNIELTQNDFGDKYLIDFIEFGFNTYKINYSASQYEKALLFDNSDATYLNSLMQYGKYSSRLFDTSQFTNFTQFQQFQIKFKYPPYFNLFYIKIHVRGIAMDFEQSFYSFIGFNSLSEQSVETEIGLTQMTFNTMLYNSYQSIQQIPYTLSYTMVHNLYSQYLFDFSFR